MYKRQGKYLEALGCYRKANVLIEEYSCTKDYAYGLFKAYGKLTAVHIRLEIICIHLKNIICSDM